MKTFATQGVFEKSSVLGIFGDMRKAQKLLLNGNVQGEGAEGASWEEVAVTASACCCFYSGECSLFWMVRISSLMPKIHSAIKLLKKKKA